MVWCGLPVPYQVLDELEVEYETVPGWNQSIAKCRKFEELPPQAQVGHPTPPLFGVALPPHHSHDPPLLHVPIHSIQAYVRRIEELVGVPIRWIGVGDGRLDVVDRGPEYTLRADSRWN